MSKTNKPSLKRLRRDESFLGIHFDYHMRPDCCEVGKTVTPRMVKRIIEHVNPDYIQVDCKGHRGLSSYPTKVGYPAPGFVRDQLRIRLLGKPQEKDQWLEHDDWLCAAKTMSLRVKPGQGVKVFGKLYPENDNKGHFEHAATITKHGKGTIAATYINLGERYCRAQTTVIRDFLHALVRKLFPEPIVQVTGSHHVDVVVNRKDGKLLVNLVNTAGPHADPDVQTFDEIPTLGPLELLIRTARKPKTVMLCPANKKLRFRYNAGRINLTLPKLDLHDIIVIE